VDRVENISHTVDEAHCNCSLWRTKVLFVLCFAVSLTFLYFMVSKQQESAQFFQIQSCQVTFV